MSPKKLFLLIVLFLTIMLPVLFMATQHIFIYHEKKNAWVQKHRICILTAMKHNKNDRREAYYYCGLKHNDPMP